MLGDFVHNLPSYMHNEVNTHTYVRHGGKKLTKTSTIDQEPMNEYIICPLNIIWTHFNCLFVWLVFLWTDQDSVLVDFIKGRMSEPHIFWPCNNDMLISEGLLRKYVVSRLVDQSFVDTQERVCTSKSPMDLHEIHYSYFFGFVYVGIEISSQDFKNLGF